MPASAIGSTKMLITRRYSGNSHAAVRTCRSSTFSTTPIWNCRGSSSTANADSTISQNQLPYPPTPAASSSTCAAAARSNRSANPPKRPKVTNTPAARNARSLTTDSNAIAATMPSWRSEASRCPVPNRMANSASTSAT